MTHQPTPTVRAALTASESLLEEVPAEEAADYLVHLVREAGLLCLLFRLLQQHRHRLAPRHHAAFDGFLEITRRCHPEP